MIHKPSHVYLVGETNEMNADDAINPEIIGFSADSEQKTPPLSGVQTLYNDHQVFVSQYGDGTAVIPKWKRKNG